MKKLQLIIFFFSFFVSQITINAQTNDVFVNGYLRNNGTYVTPHYRTSPNGTLFDNYSTKGNYNPYTGKPGWIDLYFKVSNSYLSKIPTSYKAVYSNLFNYLTKNDSINYFNLIEHFEYKYKLFFTGLFKFNGNNIEEANKIFGIIHRTNSEDTFINQESFFWFNLTENYLNASAEFLNLYSSVDEFTKQSNYDAAFKKINNIKNPLNYFDKYLLKFNLEIDIHKYSEGINTLDSLILYADDGEFRDSLVENRTNLIDYFHTKMNFLKTKNNGTYYYALDSLDENLYHYINNYNTPLNNLKEACFQLDIESCTSNDSVFIRNLSDTSKVLNKKMDILSFSKQTYSSGSDTLVVLNLNFIDSFSFNKYKNELSAYRYKIPLSKSLAYNLNNCTGEEYLIHKNIAAGLFRNNNHQNPSFEIYLYCFINSGNSKVLSDYFKENSPGN
jgi:hypothetical protein